MLSAFICSLRTVDLRRKILFTLGIVILYRLGASIPSPGVNYPNVQKCVAQVSGWIVTTWGEATLQDWIIRLRLVVGGDEKGVCSLYERCLLGTEVVPVLRREMEARRGA